MNFMINAVNVDCDSLDATVMWQKLMVEFFDKFEYSKKQLFKLSGEIAGDTVSSHGNQSLRKGNGHHYP